jgi:hypothetical protein
MSPGCAAHTSAAGARDLGGCMRCHRPDFKPRFANMFGDEGEQIFDYL